MNKQHSDNDELIELGIASVETKGGISPQKEAGQPALGFGAIDPE